VNKEELCLALLAMTVKSEKYPLSVLRGIKEIVIND